MGFPSKLASCVLALALVSGVPSDGFAQAAAPDARLLTIPTQVYKTVSNPKENVEGWVFFLILETANERSAAPLELTLDYRANGKSIRKEVRGAAELAAIDKTDYPPGRLTGKEPSRPTFWPHALRIHGYVPATLAIDSIHATLKIRAGNETRSLESTIPVVTYAQRTRLLFPFKGKGLVTQGGVIESGHRNRSGVHALDAVGLGDTYGPVTRPESRVEHYVGFGREIIAPAAGKIVLARNDRPDQPVSDVSDSKYYAPEYASGGDPGNSVVIDHGNGEFSMIAHLRHGSVQVRVGDVVAQGEVIGLLGNSGDTTGPHVHFQLQDGPRWEYSDGLPARFENVQQTARGSFFDAQ